MSPTQYPRLPILLVDDEEQFLLSASIALSSEGMTHVVQCQDSRDVMKIIQKQPPSVISLDMHMPYYSGLDLLPQIVGEYPEIPVVVITAVNDVDTAVECMKLGAFDYVVKPVDDARLITSIRRALEIREVRNENILLKQYLLSGKLEHPEVFEHIITQSSAMRSIFQYIEAVAATPLPVLITGETGTGKELIASAVHKMSGRSGEFVPVNVAGVDDQLFSDTLFGHKKGAYTNAVQDRRGLIEQAASGTLFLDEIGDLSMESQVKLLRLLQEGQYYPLGADMPKLSDARIVVATHQNIDEMQKSDRFRKDLYYRLKSHHIHIPPLKERKEDIEPLVNHFLEKAADKLDKKKPTPPRELYTLLRNYHFPGNIRELEGMIFDAVSRHKSGTLSTETFRNQLSPGDGQTTLDTIQETLPCSDQPIVFGEPLPTLKDSEQILIEEALKRSEGNQTIAAQMLGLTRRALNNRLQRSRD